MVNDVDVIDGFPSRKISNWGQSNSQFKKIIEDLDKLQLNHIEWIITKDSFKDNPIFTEDLSDYSHANRVKHSYQKALKKYPPSL